MLEVSIRHVLVGVNSCEICVIRVTTASIATFLRKIPEMWAQDLWVDLNTCVAPLFNEDNILSNGDDWVEVRLRILLRCDFYILCPSRPLIDIHIIICYISKLQLLRVGLWVTLTCKDIYIWICQKEKGKRTFISIIVEPGVTFFAQISEKLGMGS